MAFKKNSLLYLAVFIPIAMVVITYFLVQYYRVTLHPKYSFLYVVLKSTQYNCLSQLESKLKLNKPSNNSAFTSNNANTNQNVNCDNLDLSVYSFQTRSSSKITLDQAQKLSLTPRSQPISQDGFSIQSYCYPSSDLGWWGGDFSSFGSICLKKGDYQERINLKRGQDNTYFYFLGWILSPNP